MNSLIGFLRNGRLVLAAIAISVILAALIVNMLPDALMINPVTTKAENTAQNLKNAISAYFTENRKYPAFDSTHDTDLNTDFHLMDLLVGADYTLKDRHISPRRIAYYSGREAKQGEDERYRSGISKTPDGRSELWDPWGNHYRVRLDTNHDNQVADPTGGDAPVLESVLIWSAGPDGNFATWKDNLKTW